MLFNSYEFIFLFLPITFGIYFWFTKKKLIKASKRWLVFTSLFFYSWWNIIYLPLILGSVFFNFAVGFSLSKAESSIQKIISRKLLLVFGIISNIILLAYFKYMNFFILNTNLLFHTQLDLIPIILPLGISFFTFTQIAYLVDAYRYEVNEMDYLNYTLFVTFFPHLLAGPILHHKEMMPQFDSFKNKAVNYQNIASGLFLFFIGLFKKVIIADTFAQWANAGFKSAETLDLFEAWATSLSYTFQLYFDFSGYTDMALGVALLFNIHLPINFNGPYKALDIQDFWRRWHITLSRFLRDYIYIPLGGNRNGELRTYTNLFSVFLIGGLWHGASWMFIIWGALHGSAIILHRVWKSFSLTMNKYIAWFITFNFINITWIFFRAENWENAKNILLGLLGFNGIVLSDKYAEKLSFLLNYHIFFGEWLVHIKGNKSYTWILAALVMTFLLKNSVYYVNQFKPNIFNLIVTIVISSYAISNMSKISEFLYFNF